jgi:hypothetical protein
MPALNFMKQFAPLVESGEKKQTIRARRKDGRDPKKGQTLYLYTGMRSSGCRKLKEAECKDVQPIVIEDNYDIYVGAHCLDALEEMQLAEDDGFESRADFYLFFKKTHGLPFYGFLIKW